MHTIEVIQRFNSEFLKRKNATILEELFSNDFINHTAPLGLEKDITSFREFGKILHNGFPDLKVNIIHMIAEDDLVFTYKILAGTHLGEIMGKLPTGKKVQMNVMDVVRMKTGKYSEHWSQSDILQIIESL